MGYQSAPGGATAIERRAARVVDLLKQMWGDELPPTADPVQSVMTDAVDADDEQGRAGGFVVQGDALTLDVLQQLLHIGGSAQDRLLLLPPDLAQRLVGRIVGTSPLSPNRKFGTGN